MFCKGRRGLAFQAKEMCKRPLLIMYFLGCIQKDVLSCSLIGGFSHEGRLFKRVAATARALPCQRPVRKRDP